MKRTEKKNPQSKIIPTKQPQSTKENPTKPKPHFPTQQLALTSLWEA